MDMVIFRMIDYPIFNHLALLTSGGGDQLSVFPRPISGCVRFFRRLRMVFRWLLAVFRRLRMVFRWLCAVYQRLHMIFRRLLAVFRRLRAIYQPLHPIYQRLRIICRRHAFIHRTCSVWMKVPLFPGHWIATNTIHNSTTQIHFN